MPEKATPLSFLAPLLLLLAALGIVALPAARKTPLDEKKTAASHQPTGGQQTKSVGYLEPLREFFNIPSAKKPIQRLSGDQNGSWASSVPANWCAST